MAAYFEKSNFSWIGLIFFIDEFDDYEKQKIIVTQHTMAYQSRIGNVSALQKKTSPKGGKKYQSRIGNVTVERNKKAAAAQVKYQSRIGNVTD